MPCYIGKFATSEVKMTQKTRVLVVDDDFDNADMTVMMLEFSGYEARAAFDSEQAVRRVAGWVPDCVLIESPRVC